MAVKFQDYYETLGVDRKASDEAIRRAYRKLAAKYHPDVNKDPEAEAKFKQVSEAYEVLKDPEKRKRYDQLGQNWKAGQDFRPPPGFEDVKFEFGGRGGQGGFNFRPGGQFSDFFEMFFGRSQGGGFGGNARGQGRGDPFAGFSGQPRPATREQEHELQVSLQEAFHGGTRKLSLQSPDGGTKSIDVKIPAGTRDGQKMRLKREGIVLKVKVAADPRFRLQGDHLVATVNVSPWEAALGAKVALQTIDGEVEVAVPPGSQGGQKLRLKGKGMPAHGKNVAGDLLAEIRVAVPKQLSDRERELFEQLRDESEFDPRHV